MDISNTPMSIIKTENLTKRFDAVLAVDNLTIEIPEGEIFGLVGPDGAGKTTSIRLLTGILDPTSGQGWVCGKNIEKESEQVKKNIAYMSQRFGLYEDLTVHENINFYSEIYCVAPKEKKKRIDKYLEFAGLTQFKKRLAGNLSGGMKQKLGLACALVHEPKVLFLDEPTNGVDPVSRRDFWQILYQLLSEKVTIFFSTAYLDEAERCKRIALMHKGKLLRCDNPAQIKKEKNTRTLEEAFIEIIHEQK